MKAKTMLLAMVVPLAAFGSAASAADKPAEPRACANPVQRVVTPAAPANFKPGQQPAMTIRAVELRVGACSVLLAANGTVFEVPAMAEAPATMSRAR
ncbi:hypothetical protein [Novosphingobium sp. JCM 18896]|uniref:hypothetical protein n=1 Tax=Novosphingobium sp. JCM 18896 TaxID=2989731 RepID=UPI00222388DA|nr:hypothetical protein [Novosphingobium sp. JCM 18896]MCW1431806.1 hypothetical protein [Novosphingobium sp. JCM 18896]